MLPLVSPWGRHAFSSISTAPVQSDQALIAVTITGRHASQRKPANQVVRYDFVRDGTDSEIDDVKGASDGEPWSVRGMLTDSFKNQRAVANPAGYGQPAASAEENYCECLASS